MQSYRIFIAIFCGLCFTNITAQSQIELQEPDRIISYDGLFTSAIFSPVDENLLLTTTKSDGALLWDIKNQEVIQTYPIENGVARNAAFSPDGSLIAIGKTFDNQPDYHMEPPHVYVFETHTGELLYNLNFDHNFNSSIELDFSDNGTRLLVRVFYAIDGGLSFYETKTWDISNGNEVYTLHNAKAFFTSDDRLVLEEYDPQKRQRAISFLGNTESVPFPNQSFEGILFTDHSLFLTRTWFYQSGEHRISIRKFNDGTIHNQFRIPSSYGLAISSDKHLLLTGDNQSGFVRIWNIHSQNEMIKLKHDSDHLSGNFSQVGDWVVTFKNFGFALEDTVKLWNIKSIRAAHIIHWAIY